MRVTRQRGNYHLAGVRRRWAFEFDPTPVRSVCSTKRPSRPGTARSVLSLSPSRILDTRVGNGAPVGKVAAGGVLDLEVAGRGGVPESGAVAVVLNVTVTEPGAAGSAKNKVASRGAAVHSDLHAVASDRCSRRDGTRHWMRRSSPR